MAYFIQPTVYTYLQSVHAYYPPPVAVAPGYAPRYAGHLATGASVVGSLGSSFGGRTHVVSGSIHDLRQMDREDKQESRENTAALVGGIATVLFAGVTAYALKDFCKDREALKEARAFQQDVVPKIQDQNLRDYAVDLTNDHVKILEAKQQNSTVFLIISGVLLTAAIAAFVGGMMSIPWLITAGIVVAVAAAAGLAINIVWHWDDKLAPDDRKMVELQEFLSTHQPAPVGAGDGRYSPHSVD